MNKIISIVYNDDNGAILSFDVKTEAFIFKGVEITKDEAVFLYNTIAQILVDYTDVEKEAL